MLRDNRSRARTARVFFLVYALVCAAVALLSLVGLATPAFRLAGGTLPTTLFMGGFGLLLILQGLLAIGSYVAIILWLRRAYYNLHQLPGLHPEFSDGWAAGAWFVPFLNLVRPYTIMREVWNDTQQAAWGQVQRPATVLGWWWAAYLLKLVVGQIANRSFSDREGFSATMMALLFGSAALSCAYALLTRHIVGQAAGFEEQLALRQQVDQLGQEIATPLPGRLNQSDYALEDGY